MGSGKAEQHQREADAEHPLDAEMLADIAQERRSEEKGCKENCASAATLTAAGRSVCCAAADMASGKSALEPMPIKAKPR
ncbi:hypothetical protein [Devosia aurantiaca]|uniref:hypothetical protein n=1 Tax=Devosia aurantiaca TaxID=2714858 RepID=UPI001F22FA91|nr:hypothetical protein [Devosia aurantiaca]